MQMAKNTKAAKATKSVKTPTAVKSAKTVAPKVIKEVLNKSGLVAHIVEQTGLVAKDVKAVLASLEIGGARLARQEGCRPVHLAGFAEDHVDQGSGQAQAQGHQSVHQGRAVVRGQGCHRQGEGPPAQKAQGCRAVIRSRSDGCAAASLDATFGVVLMSARTKTVVATIGALLGAALLAFLLWQERLPVMAVMLGLGAGVIALLAGSLRNTVALALVPLAIWTAICAVDVCFHVNGLRVHLPWMLILAGGLATLLGATAQRSGKAPNNGVAVASVSTH